MKASLTVAQQPQTNLVQNRRAGFEDRMLLGLSNSYIILNKSMRLIAHLAISNEDTLLAISTSPEWPTRLLVIAHLDSRVHSVITSREISSTRKLLPSLFDIRIKDERRLTIPPYPRSPKLFTTAPKLPFRLTENPDQILCIQRWILETRLRQPQVTRQLEGASLQNLKAERGQESNTFNS